MSVSILSLGNIKYEQRISRRARHLRITVYPDARVVVTIPRLLGLRAAERFVRSKYGWLLKKINYFRQHPRVSLPAGRGGYVKNKEAARKLVTERLEFFNKRYGLKYNRVAIRQTRTRWGSCSSRGNLNFNYKILFLSPEQADYIIVHELCHLKHLDHSQNFWNLVAQTVPNYKMLSKEVRSMGA